MPDIVLGWELFTLVFTVSLGLGAGVMSMSPPGFTFAKWCFSISAFVAAARLGWWLAVEQTLTTDGLKVALATFVLFGCIGILWVGSLRWVNNRQKALVPQKQETSEATAPFTRELITASQLEGNAIILAHTPDPESIRLIINGAVYVPQTSPGMVVRGHKIFLENVPHDVPLLDIVRDEASKKSVVVEYNRDPSARHIGQQDKSTQIIPTVTSTPQTSSTQISSTNQSGGITTNYGTNYGNIFINQAPEKPARVEPSTPSLSLDTQNAMIVRLRDLTAPFGGQLRVTVEPKTQASYSFARTLAGIFRSAGWGTQFQDPLETVHSFQMYFNSMNRGMEVTGANKDLVMTVAGILRDAGCTTVSAVAQQMIRGTSPPGWNQDQHFVHIDVSYRR